jgi:hypothetical protein
MEMPGGGNAVGWDVQVDIELLLARDDPDRRWVTRCSCQAVPIASFTRRPSQVSNHAPGP